MGEFKTEVLIPVASEADVAAGVIVDAVAREDTSDAPPPGGGGGVGGVGGGGGGGSVNLQG